MNVEKMTKQRLEVIECLSAWSVHCQFQLREDWKMYRKALEAGADVDTWRRLIKDEIAALRKARRVLKEF